MKCRSIQSYKLKNYLDLFHRVDQNPPPVGAVADFAHVRKGLLGRADPSLTIRQFVTLSLGNSN